MTDYQAFIDYICNLAPEGETPLLLKQKLMKDSDGNLIYHGDGVPKATFPAYLPDRAKIKDNEAWYVNTGSFVLDRFPDGKPAAQGRYIDYVLFMMLDDIGTKSKTPPLAPTWIMETSEGSFQWGYAFTEEQPTKHEFVAAIKAIADAGYTDPGATNAVRNCRLPGSINFKRGRNEFRARLVEFHPERQYTLNDICAAIGVTPAEADSAELAPVRLKDTGSDSVLAWLSEHGTILSPPNFEGWAGVVCPNHAEHSDGNVEARYHPVNRAFLCYHGHCEHLTSQTFLDWVAENGGPKVDYGVRDDLVAERMTALYDKIEPTERFPDAAADMVAKVERQQAGRVEKSQWFSRYAYIQSDDAYFDLEKREEVIRASFNALYRHVECRSVHNAKQRVQASVCFDENREALGARVVAGMTYAAGDTVFVARDGNVYANRWRDARPDLSNVEPGNIDMWLDHCRDLVPDEQELEHIFNAMAFKVQNPSVKINHAILHGGYERSGKDTMWYPFIWAICGPDLRNYSVVDNDNLHSTWGYDYETEVMVLNELREPEAKERRALANKLKPVIAAPPDVLQVNRKGLHPYYMANRFFVLAFTNDQAPISIPSQDRRWFCVWSKNPPMDERKAVPLWNWYRAGGLEKIGAWLHARDVSAFNPKAPPMETEFKRSLIENSRSTAEAFLVDMIQERKHCFAAGAVATPLHGLIQDLQTQVPSSVKIVQAAILHALQEAGWVDRGRCASAEYKSPKHIYCAPEYADCSKSELRRMVEPISGGNIVDFKAKLK